MLGRSFYIVIIGAILVVIVGWQYAMTITPKEETVAERAEILAPGWGQLDFVPPAAGTYELPKIKKAASGEILLDDGAPAELSDYIGDKAVLLSFIYTSCSDVNGCPLATFVLHSMSKALKEVPALSDDIRLVTLSFDPERDTPEAMRSYGADFVNDSAVEWVFATTESEKQLTPILDEYGQFVFKTVEQVGDTEKVNFAHVLKSYLIDRQGYIRNIYSVSYLHPNIIINDFKTILSEEGYPQQSG
ncbi:MAG: SCO family protein [Chromatiales bacterium]|nr:SCO family protein [Chromatiales bacterium]